MSPFLITPPLPSWADADLFYVAVVGAVIALCGAIATTAVAILAWRTSRRSVDIANTAVHIQAKSEQLDYAATLDNAIADVIWAFSRHVDEIDEYDADKKSSLFGSHDFEGGPGDHHLQAAVEVAWLRARGADLPPLESLGNLTFNFKLALTSDQRAKSGEYGADLRRWRTGTMSADDLISKFENDREAISGAHDQRLRERQAKGDDT